MYFIPQITTNDCGFTCLKMLLAEVQEDENYLYLKEDESLSYYSYNELIDIARSHGVTLEGFKVHHKKEFKKEGRYPYIVTIGKASHSHAVIVDKVSFGRVIIYDPAKGRYSMSLKNFIKSWDGTLLLVQDVERLASTQKTPDITVKRKTLLPILLSIASASSLMAGLFFLKESYPSFLPILFLLAYILLELGSKFMTIVSLSSIDDQCLRYNNIMRDNQFSFYERLQQYKKNSLSHPIHILTTLIISIFVIVITIMNNVTNVILVITPLFLALAESFTFKQWKKDKEASIEHEERSIFDHLDDEHYISNVKRIHKRTYNLSIKILIKKYLFFFVMVVASFVSMLLNSTVLALPYVIFNFSIQMVLFEYFNIVFSYEDKKVEFLRSKAKLINTITNNEIVLKREEIE